MPTDVAALMPLLADEPPVKTETNDGPQKGDQRDGKTPPVKKG
jgi:hypothetical protein